MRTIPILRGCMGMDDTYKSDTPVLVHRRKIKTPGPSDF
jgi:hypothetical protein